MIRFSTSKLIVWALALSAGYYAATKIIPPPFLIEALNGAFIGVGLAVGIVYFPLVWRSLWNSEFDRASQLSIAIGLLWLSIFISRAWSAYYRYHGEDKALLNHPIIGYVIFMAIVGGSLFVSAPGYYRDNKPVPYGGRNSILLLALGCLGAVIAIFFNYGGSNTISLIHFNGRN